MLSCYHLCYHLCYHGIIYVIMLSFMLSCYHLCYRVIIYVNNYSLLDNDKCNLLITNHDEDISLKLGNEIVSGKEWVKILGIKVDNKLDFSEHVSSICRKANLKLHALARVSKFMNKEKLRILARAFLESQFGYCPLIWMFHNRH